MFIILGLQPFYSLFPIIIRFSVLLSFSFSPSLSFFLFYQYLVFNVHDHDHYLHFRYLCVFTLMHCRRPLTEIELKKHLWCGFHAISIFYSIIEKKRKKNIFTKMSIQYLFSSTFEIIFDWNDMEFNVDFYVWLVFCVSAVVALGSDFFLLLFGAGFGNIFCSHKNSKTTPNHYTFMQRTNGGKEEGRKTVTIGQSKKIIMINK